MLASRELMAFAMKKILRICIHLLVPDETTGFPLRPFRSLFYYAFNSFTTPSIQLFSSNPNAPSTLACHFPFAPPPLTRPLKTSACFTRSPNATTRATDPERWREEVDPG